MSKIDGSLKVYAAVLRLYPREHQKRYGKQMLQTVEDMLDDAPSFIERTTVWTRIIIELPMSLYTEHMQAIGDKMHAPKNPQKVRNISALVLLVLSLATVVANRLLIIYQGPPFWGLPQPLMFIAVIVVPLVILGISIRSLRQLSPITLRRAWPFVVLACIAAAYFTVGALDYIRAWRHGLFPM
jgi:hypothetical protein